MIAFLWIMVRNKLNKTPLQFPNKILETQLLYHIKILIKIHSEWCKVKNCFWSTLIHLRMNIFFISSRTVEKFLYHYYFKSMFLMWHRINWNMSYPKLIWHKNRLKNRKHVKICQYCLMAGNVLHLSRCKMTRKFFFFSSLRRLFFLAACTSHSLLLNSKYLSVLIAHIYICKWCECAFEKHILSKIARLWYVPSSLAWIEASIQQLLNFFVFAVPFVHVQFYLCLRCGTAWWHSFFYSTKLGNMIVIALQSCAMKHDCNPITFSVSIMTMCSQLM